MTALFAFVRGIFHTEPGAQATRASAFIKNTPRSLALPARYLHVYCNGFYSDLLLIRISTGFGARGGGFIQR